MVVQEWPRGIRIKIRTPKGEKKAPSKRGTISQFSRDAARRLGWAYSQGPWVGMITLTYPGAEPVTHEEFANHRNAVLESLKRRGIKYLWVLEWQGRGVPHLHIWVSQNLTDRTCQTKNVRRNLSNRICQTEYVRRKLTDGNCPEWMRVAAHWLNVIGEADNEKAVAVALHPKTYLDWEIRVGNNYASKYADKREQKGLPNGIKSYGKWWGVSRDTICPAYETEVEEETVNVKTGEVVRAVTIRRQIGRAFRTWFPNLKKHKKNSQTGIGRALRDEKRNAVLRILAFYLGEDPMQTQKTKTPDQQRYEYRQVMSLARHVQNVRESERGTKNGTHR